VIVIIVFIWLIGLYGCLIVARYIHLLRSQKREALEYMQMTERNHHENVGLLGGQQPEDLPKELRWVNSTWKRWRFSLKEYGKR